MQKMSLLFLVLSLSLMCPGSETPYGFDAPSILNTNEGFQVYYVSNLNIAAAQNEWIKNGTKGYVALPAPLVYSRVYSVNGKPAAAKAKLHVFSSTTEISALNRGGKRVAISRKGQKSKPYIACISGNSARFYPVSSPKEELHYLESTLNQQTKARLMKVNGATRLSTEQLPNLKRIELSRLVEHVDLYSIRSVSTDGKNDYVLFTDVYESHFHELKLCVIPLSSNRPTKEILLGQPQDCCNGSEMTSDLVISGGHCVVVWGKQLPYDFRMKDRIPKCPLKCSIINVNDLSSKTIDLGFGVQPIYDVSIALCGEVLGITYPGVFRPAPGETGFPPYGNISGIHVKFFDIRELLEANQTLSPVVLTILPKAAAPQAKNHRKRRATPNQQSRRHLRPKMNKHATVSSATLSFACLFLALIALLMGCSHTPQAETEPLPYKCPSTGKWGFRSLETTKNDIHPRFTYAKRFMPCGLARVSRDKKGYDDSTALFINKEGKTVIDCENYVGTFSEGLAQAYIGEKIGYITQDGNLAIPAKYDFAADFSGGLAAVYTGNLAPPDHRWPLRVQKENYKAFWGYIDRKGKLVIAQKYHQANPFSEGLAVVISADNRCMVIDKQGNTVSVAPKGTSYLWKYSDGLLAFQQGNLQGYVDHSGRIVIPAIYETANPFSEGRAAVRLLPKGKFGYIDATGKKIVEHLFDEAEEFSEGVACVRVNDLYGYMRPNGNWAIRPQFNHATSFDRGIAEAGVGNVTYYIDHQGKQLLVKETVRSE